MPAEASKSGKFLFAGRRDGARGLTTRRYARLVQEWVARIGLDATMFGTHSLRRTMAVLSWVTRQKLSRRYGRVNFPHGAVAIGPFDIVHDANGNLIRQTERGTSNVVHYVYDEENRLACVHKGAHAITDRRHAALPPLSDRFRR